MQNLQYYNQQIKDRIKFPELLQFYGFDIKRGRMKCPFHNGKDYNCGIKQNYIHCFVCGESADVIGFVQKYFNLDFKQTLQKLNDDFGLNLPIGERLSQKQQLNMAKEKHKREQAKKQKEKEYDEILKDFLNAHSEVIRLECQASQYRPKYFADEPHPLFIDYLKNIDKAKYNLECAEMELIKWKTQN